MTEYAYLFSDIKSVMNESDNERLRIMDQPQWISYPRAKVILDELESCLSEHQNERMENLLIIGESNNGKTTLIRYFYSLHGASYKNDKEITVHPIILIQAPPKADEKALLISILEQFSAIYNASSPLVKLRSHVIQLMRECEVKILIIDELQSMLSSSIKKQVEVMNVLKYLRNELMIPIICVGTKDAVMVLHTDKEHASRFAVIELPQWEFNKEFQALLAGFEKCLPLKKRIQNL